MVALAGAYLASAGYATAAGVSLSAAAGTTIAGLTVASWGALATSVVFSAYQNNRARQKARDAQNASFQDRRLTIRSTNAPRVVPYGKTMVGGVMFDAFVYKEGVEEYLTIAVAVAGCEIDSFEALHDSDGAIPLAADGSAAPGSKYHVTTTESGSKTVYMSAPDMTVTLDHDPISGSVAAFTAQQGEEQSSPVPLDVDGRTVTLHWAAGTQVVVSYTYQGGVPYLWARFYRGAASQQADAQAIAESGGYWTAAHRGDGVAYVLIRMRYSQAVYASGILSPRFIVRGKKVWNPQTGTTEYSCSPPLCAADYLRARIGFSATLDEIDWDDASAAMTDCAAGVAKAIGTYPIETEALYECHGAITAAMSRREALEQILGTMAGRCVYSQGRFRIFAGVYRQPEFFITDAALTAAQPLTGDPALGSGKRCNTVKGTFSDAAQGYEITDYVPQTSAYYRERDDGIEVARDFDLPMTSSSFMAQRIAKIVLEQANQSFTLRFSADLSLYRIVPGSVLQWTSALLDFVKVFYVASRTLTQDGDVILSVQEDSPEIYDWRGGVPTAYDYAPNTAAGSAFVVPSPLYLTLSSGTDALQLLSDGTILSRIKVDLPPVPSAAVAYGGIVQIQYRVAGTVAWNSIPDTPGDSRTAFIGPVRDGWIYEVRARYRNALGVESDWVYASPHTVMGKLTAPSNVGPLTVVREGLHVRISWPRSTDPDIAYYQVRYGPTWAESALIEDVDATSCLWVAPGLGTFTVHVKAIDTSGGGSVQASSATVEVTVATAPALTAEISGPDLILWWPVPESAFPIARYEIGTGDAMPSVFPVDVANPRYQARVTWSGSRTWWVRVVDTQGNRGAAASVAVTVVRPPKVLDLRATVVDNFALLFWSPGPGGTLPVVDYEVRRGDVYSSSISLGSNGASTFAALFERAAGTYTHWVTAVDSAGNRSDPASIRVTVSAPPDFVLRGDFSSTWGGTKTNAAVDGATLVMLFDDSSWDAHYATRGWANDQAAIDAGYPLYWQPGTTAASYAEVFALDALASSITLDVSATVEYSAGQPAYSLTLSVSDTSASGPWTVATVINGALTAQIVTANVRWIKVEIAAQGTGGDDLLVIRGLRVQASLKRVTDEGTVAAVAGDPGGTWVSFNRPFLDVEAIVVSPQTVNDWKAVFDFDDILSPSGFRVLVFDASGNRASCPVHWTARGV